MATGLLVAAFAFVVDRGALLSPTSRLRGSPGPARCAIISCNSEDPGSWRCATFSQPSLASLAPPHVLTSRGRIERARLSARYSESVRRRRPRFLSYYRARQWGRASHLETEQDWRDWIESGEDLVSIIPARPEQVYGAEFERGGGWPAFLNGDIDEPYEPSPLSEAGPRRRDGARWPSYADADGEACLLDPRACGTLSFDSVEGGAACVASEDSTGAVRWRCTTERGGGRFSP